MTRVPNIPFIPFQSVNQPNTAIPDQSETTVFEQLGALLGAGASAAQTVAQSQVQKIEDQAQLRSLRRRHELEKAETTAARKKAELNLIEQETSELAEKKAELAIMERDRFFAATYGMNGDEAAAFAQKYRLADPDNQRVQATELGKALARQYGDVYSQRVTQKLVDMRAAGQNPAMLDEFSILEQLVDEVQATTLQPMDENDTFMGTAFAEFQDALLRDVKNLKSTQARAYIEQQYEDAQRNLFENARADMIGSWIDGDGSGLSDSIGKLKSNAATVIGIQNMPEEELDRLIEDRMVLWIGEGIKDGMFPSTGDALDYFESIPGDMIRLRKRLGLTKDADGNIAPTGMYAQLQSMRQRELQGMIGGAKDSVQQNLKLLESNIDAPPEMFDLQRARLDRLYSQARDDSERQYIEQQLDTSYASIELARNSHIEQFDTMAQMRVMLVSGKGDMLGPEHAVAFSAQFKKQADDGVPLANLIGSYAASGVRAEMIPWGDIQRRTIASLKNGVGPGSLAEVVGVYRAIGQSYGNDVVLSQIGQLGMAGPSIGDDYAGVILPVYAMSLQYRDRQMSDGTVLQWSDHPDFQRDVQNIVSNMHLVQPARAALGDASMGYDEDFIEVATSVQKQNARIAYIGQQLGGQTTTAMQAATFEGEFISEFIASMSVVSQIDPEQAKDEEYLRTVANGASSRAAMSMRNRSALIALGDGERSISVNAETLNLLPDSDPASLGDDSPNAILEQVIHNVETGGGPMGVARRTDLSSISIVQYRDKSGKTYRAASIPVYEVYDGKFGGAGSIIWPLDREMQYEVGRGNLDSFITSNEDLGAAMFRGFAGALVDDQGAAMMLPPLQPKSNGVKMQPDNPVRRGGFHRDF